MGVSDVISLLSGIALFLFGMNIMGDGLKKVAGSKLEVILYRLSGNAIKGVLLGTGVTAVIQSSSATSVMVVGFVNSGMMKVKQAIGIVMGAVLGTSITGWIICLSSIKGGSGWVEMLSTATLTGVVAVIGIVLKMFCKSQTKKHIGDILMGFAVLMFGMSAMSDSVSGANDLFTKVFTELSNPLIAIVAGCIVTCILQSASAAVGILQAITISGSVTFDVAFPLIMGIAIGAAVPVLISSVGTNVNGKRTAFVYLLVDLLGVIIIAPVFYILNAVFDFTFMSKTMSPVLVAAANTLFRFVMILILIPFIGILEKTVCLLFKSSPDEEEDNADIDRLEDRFIIHPALAIEQSRQAMASMIRKTVKNLARAFELFDGYSDEAFDKIQEKESVIDRYEDKLGTYLVKITQNELNRKQNIEISKFLHTISDIERIGDHAVNLSLVAQEIHDKKLEFSSDACQEIDVIRKAVLEIVDLSTTAFCTDDKVMAARVEPLEEVIDQLCDQVKLNHVSRIQSGDCTLTHGFVFNDLLSNYERIADHSSNLAVAVIELDESLFDTHEYLNSVKNEKPAEFLREIEQFKEKYNIGNANA